MPTCVQRYQSHFAAVREVPQITVLHQFWLSLSRWGISWGGGLRPPHLPLSSTHISLPSHASCLLRFSYKGHGRVGATQEGRKTPPHTLPTGKTGTPTITQHEKWVPGVTITSGAMILENWLPPFRQMQEPKTTPSCV